MWLGECYKTQVLEEEYSLEFDMSIPEEYLRKKVEELPDIHDLIITIMGVEKGKAEEIAVEMLNSSFKLFENDKGWVWDIGRYEY